MIHIVPSKDRYFADNGWLQTYHHFSFADYHDPKNVHWGALRVFNDDVIQPGQGFGLHPHRDMEIVTCVLEGALEHKDTLGNTGVVRPGEVQVMSAGRGIAHSEYNHSKSDSLRLMQIWIFPRTRGLKPRWEQRVFLPEEREGRLLPVVSGGAMPGTLSIDQDAAIYLSSLRSGDQVTHSTERDRKVYAFVMKGGMAVNGRALNAGDQARIEDESALTFAASKDTELILLDLPNLK